MLGSPLFTSYKKPTGDWSTCKNFRTPNAINTSYGYSLPTYSQKDNLSTTNQMKLMWLLKTFPRQLFTHRLVCLNFCLCVSTTKCRSDIPVFYPYAAEYPLGDDFPPLRQIWRDYQPIYLPIRLSWSKIAGSPNHARRCKPNNEHINSFFVPN